MFYIVIGLILIDKKYMMNKSLKKKVFMYGFDML